MTTNWLAALAAAATSLDERICGVTDSVPPPGEEAAKRLAEWSRRSANSDPETWELRLAADGVDQAEAIRAVGDPVWPEGQELPAWTGVVSRAVALGRTLPYPAASPPGPDDPVLDARSPLPFDRTALPFVMVARELLAEQLDDLPPQLLAPGAIQPLERQLLETVTTLAARIHGLRFDLLRTSALGSLGWALLQAEPDPGRRLLDKYEEDVLAGGWEQTLSEYPVCARLLGEAVNHWVLATKELLTHLVADWPQIHAQLSVSQCRVARLRSAGSDTHNGRSVLLVDFDDGTTVVYKPRPCGIEATFGTLCQWLDGCEPRIGLRSPRVVDRSDHGWVEFVAHAECADTQTAAGVYRQAGALLALFHALGSGDMHTENIICDGSHLVIIDVETLLVPVPADQTEMDLLALADVHRTVLTSLLLPRWIEVNSNTIDIGGLGGLDESREHTGLRWVDIGTDRIRRVQASFQVAENRVHRVLVAGVPQEPESYTDDIVAGFDLAYTVILDQRAELEALIADHADAVIRFVPRATALYARLLIEALEPASLRSGWERSLVFERIYRSLADAQPGFLRREVEQLYAGDVPWFVASAGGLVTSDGAVAMAASALDWARSCLSALSVADQQAQRSYIRAALSLRTAGSDLVGRRLPDRLPDDVAPLEAAVAIGEQLARSALRGGTPGVTWIGASPVGREAKRWSLAPIGADLYSGVPGVALFLAGLYRVTGEDRWRFLALDAVKPVTAMISQSRSSTRALGFGAQSGAAGTAWALATCAGMLGEADLMAPAEALIRDLAGLDFSDDRVLDVVGGAAGSAFVAARLDRKVFGDHAMRVADRAAARLLTARRRFGTEHGWVTLQSEPLLGFSHGAIGIAVGLAAAYHLTGSDQYRSAVADSLAFERARYDSVRHGWPDLRTNVDGMESGQPPPISSSWCHGQFGHALARVLCADFGAVSLDVETSEQIGEALDAAPLAADDSLCCGAAGIHETRPVLARRGLWPSRHEFLDVARLSADVVAHDGRPTRLAARAAPEVPAPGLYSGEAGVGWALLRAEGVDLPNLLSFEPG